MKKFSGVLTALVTPFFQGRVDFESLEKLIHFQLENDVDGFVVNGTTGESPTLLENEVKSIFEFVRERTPRSKLVVVGTGSNSTEKSCAKTKMAESWGADGALVVVPYYNKPTQKGLIEHFKKVAECATLPILLYNVPGRTVTTLELETVVQLSQIPRIVGIKEASGNIEFAQKLRKALPKDFSLLSGDDGSYEAFLAAGGDGVISVSSHLFPRQMKRGVVTPHLLLTNALFLEPNPQPVKMALHLMGLLKSPECRLPMVEASPLLTQKLRELLAQEGLLP